MPWLRIDDGFTEHRKIVALKRSERWTWMELLTYCARQGNGGHVPEGVCDILRWVTPAFLSKCADVGLLDVVDGRYEVHDWRVYNPKDPTNAARQERYRQRHSNDDVTAEVTVDVTEKVTDENVTTVTPPAQARARVPSPTPETIGPSLPPTATKNAGRTEGRNEIDQQRLNPHAVLAAATTPDDDLPL